MDWDRFNTSSVLKKNYYTNLVITILKYYFITITYLLLAIIIISTNITISISKDSRQSTLYGITYLILNLSPTICIIGSGTNTWTKSSSN